MSKAFTKESDDDGDDAAASRLRESSLPEGASNYITASGAARLRAELSELVTTARPAAQIAVAAIADIAATSEAKKRLAEIDRRIRDLTASLDSAEIVDPSGQDAARVLFGATVTVRDADDHELTYRIVGIDETDTRQGAVSWISPIARALLNQRVGDVVTFRFPKGEQELEILRIEYAG